MRAIWKGAIAFGLVNVPVKLYSATESHDVQLHQVHDRDGGRIRYQRRCEVCGEVVDYEHIDKAYDDGDRTVVLTDEDIGSLPVQRSREIDVAEFVPSEQLDPIMFGKTYYLSPDSRSTKSYVLLRRTLEETERTAIVTFTLRDRTRLGALRVRDDTLVLQALLWPDEVREADFPALDEKVSISAREMEMSAALVASFESDFDPEAFNDDYQEQLRQLISAKLEQGEAVDTETTFGEGAEEEEGGQVLDLMEALRRSVAASRKGADGEPEESGDSGADAGAEEAVGDEATGTDDAVATAPADDKPARRPTSRSRASSAAPKGGTGTTARSRTTTKEPAGRKATGKEPAERVRAEEEPAEKGAGRKPAGKRATTTKAAERTEKRTEKKAATTKPAEKKPAEKKAPAKKTASSARAKGTTKKSA